jgi:iron complex outermembrane receptor protein
MRANAFLIGTAAFALTNSFLPTAAHGQSSPAPTPKSKPVAEAQKATDTALEEIVVTAQFRSENLQKTAVPVDVVTGGTLTNAGVITPSQLTTVVPALQISQSNGGSPSLYIRGVGTLTQNSYTDPGVAFNVDGIYIGRPTSIANTFFDLERIEVLKGPQGTLYGRNATGGAINVLPNKPRLGEYSGTIGASYGNYDDARVDAAINVPLGATVAARIAGTYNRHDGYLSDGTNDAKGGAVRGQLLFKPSNEVSIRLSADYAHEGGRGTGSTISGFINPLTGVRTANPLPRYVGLEDPRAALIIQGQYSFQTGRYFEPITDRTYKNNSFWGFKGELGADLRFAKLTVLAARRQSDLNSNDIGLGIPFYTNQQDHQTSFEARLASPDKGVFRWLAGAYYYDEGIHSRYEANLSNTASLQDLRTGTRSYAGFGRVTVAPVEGLRLVGGVRYTHDIKRFNGTADGFNVICTRPAFPMNACPAAPLIPFATSTADLLTKLNLVMVAPNIYIQPSAAAANVIYKRVPRIGDRKLTTNRTTFRAAVEYDVGPRSLLYASYETGFHAGGFAFSTRAPTFNPESITAYTIGSKNRFLDGKLQVNLEAFLWKYKDQQITHFAIDTGAFLVFITENAGSSTNKGVELSTEWRPVRNSTLHLDVQYLDAKYDKFEYVSPTRPVPLITGCPTTPVDATTARVDCSGFRALRSPKWTINGGIVQVLPMGRNNITVAVDTHYQSKMVNGFEMLPVLSEQKAYFSTNASVDFSMEKKWSLGAFVNNIENNRPLGQSSYNLTNNLFNGSPLPPRTYGLRGRFNF